MPIFIRIALRIKDIGAACWNSPAFGSAQEFAQAEPDPI
jgi:hypothetical protein